MPPAPRVALLTGSLLDPTETSLPRAIRKQWAQWRASERPWLDLKVRMLVAEHLLAARRERKRADAAARDLLAGLLDGGDVLRTPELTEVVLATLLAREGLPYDLLTYHELFADPEAASQKLDQATCVFASTTLVRDLGEFAPILDRLQRPGLRIVVGGALASMDPSRWAAIPQIDVVAAGYGEFTVPALARWIRSGFQDLVAPERGSIERIGHIAILRSGVPEGLSLDSLAEPDWAQSRRDRQRPYRMVHYESVRGCPYRCAFCNYPYLFDDTRFRTKSATRVVDDWIHLHDEQGVEFVNCLDSLFTMPKRRLLDICDLLIGRGAGIKWICYARADDLDDVETVRLMKKAGAHLIHVGLESGDQGQLDNMAKRCTVESNQAAMRHCRQAGLTTLASLIVGFPGETKATVEATFKALAAAPPDFHWISVFNARMEGVPILRPESRARFGLKVAASTRSASPYWTHTTQSCLAAANHVRRLERSLALERVSLNAALFYPGILDYDPSHREPLLAFQHNVVARHPLMGKTFDALHAWVDRHLAADLQSTFAAAAPSSGPVTA